MEVGQQLLLSIGLLLRRAPSVVRTPDFASQVEDWYEQISAGSARISRDKSEIADKFDNLSAPRDAAVVTNHYFKTDAGSTRSDASGLKIERLAQPPELSEQEPQTETVNLKTTPQTTPASEALRPWLPPEAVPVASRRESSARVDEAAGSDDVQFESTSVSDLDVSLAEAESIANESETRASERVDDSFAVKREIATEFGGLFYLINLSLYLNLYSDFTTPASAGIELNIWDFVALVGEELVGANDDPIWPFLAELAGREPDRLPGDGFVPPADWRTAPEWLSGFGTEEAWRWTASDGRLQLAHPQGFLVLDVACDGDPTRQLQAEVMEYENVLGGSIDLVESSAIHVDAGSLIESDQISPALRTWLSRLMPYVRARLRLALGPNSKKDPGTVLCRQPASVQATDTHIDVFFGLSDLPLEIRFAGLDRDPGWVPAAGRFIGFHFD